jgi:hypothetical protein
LDDIDDRPKVRTRFAFLFPSHRATSFWFAFAFVGSEVIDLPNVRSNRSFAITFVQLVARLVSPTVLVQLESQLANQSTSARFGLVVVFRLFEQHFCCHFRSDQFESIDSSRPERRSARSDLEAQEATAAQFTASASLHSAASSSAVGSTEQTLIDSLIDHHHICTPNKKSKYYAQTDSFDLDRNS